MLMSPTLTVNEIFHSLQGEGTRAGLPCTLVRLTGCNLRCTWCDTTYAFDAGEPMTIDEILQAVAAHGGRRVEVTGGEPLVQPACPRLLARLVEAGWETLLETNGTRDIAQLDPRVIRIVDVKCPSSGQAEQTLWTNLDHLTARDEVKFVVADEGDVRYALATVAGQDLDRRCPVTLSPVAGRIEPARLAERILDSGRDVRLGIQLHKFLWPGRERGV
jgi:7-carboxy-7-deazaguanine synthase